MKKLPLIGLIIGAFVALKAMKRKKPEPVIEDTNMTP